MTINTKELIDAIGIVADNHSIRLTVKKSLKGTLIVTGITLGSALLLGPIGLLIGGTLGGYSAYRMSQGTFRPLSSVLQEELNYGQKEKICEHVVAAFRDFNAGDVALLLPLLLSSANFQSIVLAKVVEFVSAEMKMQIVD